MQLDQILGLAERAIPAVVDPLGRADIEARDDERCAVRDSRTLPYGASRYSRAEQASSRWRVGCGCRRRPRRLFWRAAWYRTGRRCPQQTSWSIYDRYDVSSS